jgi:hypothetical protein
LALTNVNGSQLVTDTFVVEYFRDNPQTVYGNVVETPDIDHVSFVEYWTVSKISGNASKFVTLTVGALSFATDATKLRVARYDGAGTWLNNGQTFASGPYTDPYVGEITGISTNLFGPFTLASTEPSPVNPLPVRFVNVNAKKTDADGLVSWEVSEKPQPGTGFFVEHSRDGRDFFLTGRIIADDRLNYQFTDTDLPKGISYYRVKAKETGGRTIVSNVVTIVNDNNYVYLTKLSPNPATGKAHLHLFSSKPAKAILSVTDINGKIIQRISMMLPEGNTNFVIDVSALGKGIYLISGQSGGKQINSIRFVKQ